VERGYQPPRIVLDPCVLIAGVLTPRGACAELLRAWRAGKFELVASPHLLWELAVVLKRERFRRYLSLEDARDFVTILRQRALVLPDPPVKRGATLDPGDDYLPALANAAGASFLASVDHHLTDVPGLSPPVVKPDQLLEWLHSQPSPTRAERSRRMGKPGRVGRQFRSRCDQAEATYRVNYGHA
jgi:putative PIN family toxin of toxin-antitoxin system